MVDELQERVHSGVEIVQRGGDGGAVARDAEDVVRLVEEERGVGEVDAHGLSDAGVDDVVVGGEDDLARVHHLARDEVRTGGALGADGLQVLDVDDALDGASDLSDAVVRTVLAGYV